MSYKEIFSGIYENYGFGSSESRSGPGSTLEETKLLREEIKKLIVKKGIKSVVDIPCGDFHWMKEIVFNFDSYDNNKRSYFFELIPDIFIKHLFSQ